MLTWVDQISYLVGVYFSFTLWLQAQQSVSTLQRPTKEPFRTGMQIILGATDAEICLVEALQIYFKIKNSTINSPLYSYRNGTPLSRKSFTKDVCNLWSIGGLDPTHYACHSFRIGAATGVPSSQLGSSRHWGVGPRTLLKHIFARQQRHSFKPRND